MTKYCFNRNIVECKLFSPLNYTGKNRRFNRNIVECKYRCKCRTSSPAFVLIETLWNVNFVLKKGILFRSPVLIETLWNVNELPACQLLCPVNVLIETLWNVNGVTDRQGINSSFVLIETLWNVNGKFMEAISFQSRF